MNDTDFFGNTEPGRGHPDFQLEGCLILGYDLKYRYVNEAAARQRHLTPQDMLGKHVLEIFPDSEHAPVFAKGLISLRQRIPQRELFGLPAPGGGTTWLDLSTEPVPEGLLIRSKEVSEPLEASGREAGKRAPGVALPADPRYVAISEERYRSVFLGMSEGFALQEIVLDGQGEPCDSRFLDVNHAFELLTGFGHQRVVGNLAGDCVPPGPLWGASFGPVARTGRSLHLEAHWAEVGRHFEIFSYSPVPGQFAVLFRDITARKVAEAEQHDHAAVLEAINDIFHAAMTRETQEEVADRCLQAACRLTSSPHGVVFVLNGQGSLDCIAAHLPDWKAAPISRAKAMARLRNLPLSGPLGALIPGLRSYAGPPPESLADHPVPLTRILAVPLQQGDRCAGLVLLANKKDDFSAEDLIRMETVSRALGVALARKRSELAVQELNSHLELRSLEMQAALDELDSFSYSVSHDLRAPLRHVIGFAELLQRELQDHLEGKAAHYLGTILASSRHMGHLIDELLSFSRTGRVAVQKRKVDLEALVKDVIAGMEPEYGDRRVAWEVGPLPTVSGDPVLLRSVFVNLLSNALKFTRKREEARIRIGSETRGRELVVWVADNGAGFDPRHADKLFGVFQRLHPAAEFEGSGIGLANVRRIIMKHGGRTWATGARDEGATFHFSLPAPRERSGA